MPCITCTVSLVPRNCSGDWFIIVDPPTSREIVPLPAARSVTPGISTPTASALRLPSAACRSLRGRRSAGAAELSTSTRGASAVTVIVSVCAPSVSCMSMAAVKSGGQGDAGPRGRRKALQREGHRIGAGLRGWR